MIEVLDPTHEEEPSWFRPARRLPGLSGAVVGLISNGKQGTEPFFDALEARLIELGAAEVDRVVKANYSAPAEASIMDRARRWQALVAGVGD